MKALILFLAFILGATVAFPQGTKDYHKKLQAKHFELQSHATAILNDTSGTYKDVADHTSVAFKSLEEAKIICADLKAAMTEKVRKVSAPDLMAIETYHVTAESEVKALKKELAKNKPDHKKVKARATNLLEVIKKAEASRKFLEEK